MGRIRATRDSARLAPGKTGDKARYNPKPTPVRERYAVPDRGQNGLPTFAARLTSNAYHRWTADGCYEGKHAVPIAGAWKDYVPNKASKYVRKATKVL